MKRWLSWPANYKSTNGNIILSILSNFVAKKTTLEIPKTNSTNSISWKSPCIEKPQFQEVKAKLNKGMHYPDAFSDIHPLFLYDSNILLSLVNFFQDNDQKMNLQNTNFYILPLSYVIFWLSCPNLSCVDKTENGTNIDLTREYELLIQVILLSYNLMNLDYYYFCLDSVSTHFFRYGNSKKFPFWIIPTLFERPDPQLLDIAASIISFLTKEKQTDSTNKLIECLSLNVFKFSSNYREWNFELIINSLLPLLAQFDLNALSLFAALATVRIDPQLEEAFYDIPRIYNSKLMSTDQNKSLSIDNIFEAEKQANLAYQQQFTPSNYNQCLPSDLNPPPISEFQASKDFQDFLGESDFSKLQLLLSLFGNALPQYVNSFLSGFITILQSKNSQDYSLQFFITFIYALEKIQHYEFKKSMFDIITGKLIFMPNISIFYKNEYLKKSEQNENAENFEFDFELITFLRKSVLLILAKHAPNYIGILLKDIEGNPFLFADVIGRIHINLEKFDLNYLTNEMSLGAVIHVISNLSDLSHHCDAETLQKISQARSTILIYLLSIFENTSVAVRCFSSSVFTQGFLAQIFDPSFQKPITMVLKQFLSKSKGNDVGKILTPTLDFISRIIDVCSSMDDEDNHDSVAYDLLVTVNDSSLHNRLLPLKFESLITASTHYLAVRPSVKFLDQTLQLYSQMLFTSNHYSVSNVQIQQLSIAIRRSDGIHPSDATVCCLIGMMARSRSDNVNASFFVQEPKISILLFSIIQTKEDTLKYISLFYELCQYSAYNCIQCHRGELDLLLITMMRNYPNSFTFRGCQFDLIISKEDVIKYVFPLMFLIASYESSPQFCAGILSLMAPSIETVHQNLSLIDNQHNVKTNDFKINFPEFSSNIITQLSSVVTKIAQDPEISLQLGLPDRIITIEGLKSQDLEKGFTFQFFLFVDVHSAKISKMRPMILKISDGDKSEIQFYIQGSSIVCWINSFEDTTKNVKISSSKNSLFGVLYTNLPSCTWVRVTLIIQNFNNYSTISFALNNSIQSTFNLSLPTFSDKQLNLEIGGMVDPSSIDGEVEGDSQIETLAYIGAFRFFNEPITRNDLTDLSELGSRNLSNNDSLNSLFSYPPLEKKNNSNIVGQRIFKIEKIGQSFPIYEDIIDNLKNHHVLSLMVPFFLYCEKMPPHFLELFLDILYHVVENEEQFPFFPLIGQILTNKPKLTLTYGLYLKFFAFAENDDQLLVKSLIEHILLNVELWSIAESSQFIRIVSHWNQTLYPSFHNLVDQCFNFSALLAYTRIYLWYKPIEIELIRCSPGSIRPRDENLDIETCRSHYMKFLLSFVSTSPGKFTSKDAQTIISHCASCQDHQQVFSLLILFMNIINFNKLKLKIPETSSRLIYLQFKPQHEERFSTAYKVLYSLTSSNKLHIFTEVIISLMNKLFFTEKLFNECTKLIMKENCPCSYTLCIFIAMNLGKSQCEQMANILAEMSITTELSVLFKYNEKWCAWPLALLSELTKKDNVSNDSALKVISFLLNVLYADFSLDALDVVINTFDLFSFIFGSTFEEYSRVFFTKIATHFLSSENRDLKAEILNRCIKMLTLRVNDPPEMGLRVAFVNSPFYDSSIDINLNFENLNQFKSLEYIINDLTENLQDTINYNHDNIPNFYKFGIVLNTNNQPLFEDLYKITQNYIESLDSSNSMVAFWNQTYQLILNKKLNNEEKENLARLFSPYSLKAIVVNNKINLMIYKSILKSIEENRSESKSAIESPDPSEISIALNDIFNYSLKYQSTRDLKKMFRLSMQEDSFWDDSRYRLSAYSRSFISDSSYAQPFLKKVFSDSALFKSQFISKSSSLIFASINNNNSDVKYSHLLKSGEKLPKGAFLCKHIKFTKEIDAIFKFSSKGDHLKIIKPSSCQRIDFINIKRIFIRWRFLRPNALEFYLKDGDSVLVDFTPIDATTVLSKFTTFNPQLVQTVSPQEFFDTTDFKKQWSEGHLSNFDYLMILNIFSGRTFNDPAMYPIFPWVLSNYTDPKKIQYRDLSRPIAVQKKEQMIIYFLSPSTPMLLSYFLSRVEPYASIPQKLKIKKLQLSDLPFKSMQATYEMATSEKIKNCWELTPEFYSSPHFFGKKLKSKDKLMNMYDGKAETQFELPSWASTEEEFIYLHRRELESPYVSKSLNRWIDLVFGYISRGNRAQRADNVFNDVMFTEPSSNKEDQAELEADLRKIGQLPALLFKKPHPQKTVFPRSQKFPPPQPIPLNIPRVKQNDEADKDDSSSSSNFGIISATIIEADYMTIHSFVYCSDGTVHKVRTDFMVSLNCMTSKIGNIKIGSGIDLSYNTVSDTIISPVSIVLSPQQLQQQQQQQIVSTANLNEYSDNSSISISNDSLDHFSISSLTLAKTSLITATAASSMPVLPSHLISLPPESRSNESAEILRKDDSTSIDYENDNSLLIQPRTSSISSSYSTPLPPTPGLFTLPTLVANNSNEIIICSILNGFIVVDNKKRVLYLAKERKITEYNNILVHSIICMASSEHLIAATCTNGEVFGWDDHNFEEKIHFCCVTSDIVTSLAISSKFGIIACGTSSGDLCVFSIYTHMLQFIVKLPAEPSRIIITPGWGFIVAESSQELFLISVTGKVIRRAKVDFVIAKWNSWSCERGLDFIVIADTKGQIRMSEAFYIKFDEVVFQSKTKILDMKYVVLTRGIVIISADGYARLIPKGLPQ